MKTINLYAENGFSDKGMKTLLVHDSPYFKILNFNFRAGQELAVHHHDIEGSSPSRSSKGRALSSGRTGRSCLREPGTCSSRRSPSPTASGPPVTCASS